jgi:hypothetical protein
MKWVWIALAVVVGLVVLVAVTGALLPVKHSAVRRLVLRQPASAIFAVLTDVAAMPQWRTGRKVVTRIVPEGSPFGGTWTFALKPVADGTELAITEDGEIYNVMYRTLARFVFGYTSTIDSYLLALATKFGEQARAGD